jgi:uncharacterized cysteine cluster protein YcgN (CxxCxxCC family)
MLVRLIRNIRRRRERWESLCDHCGLCCYHRSRVNGGGVFINYDRPCRFLDAETGLCTVYERRFELNPDCRKVTILHAKFDRLMPPTCAYVRAYRRRK